MDPKVFLGRVAVEILNPLIILGFVIAIIYFFYGVAKFIWNADQSAARDEGKKSVMYGIIGLVVMFSVYGILNFITATFNLPSADLPL